MTLAELLDNLDNLDNNLTIYAERNLFYSAASGVIVFPKYQDENLSDEVQGMNYLLEVPPAKEAMQVWSE